MDTEVTEVRVSRGSTLLLALVAMAACHLPLFARETYFIGLTVFLWVGSYFNYMLGTHRLPPMGVFGVLLPTLWPLVVLWQAGKWTRALIIKRRTPAPPSE